MHRWPEDAARAEPAASRPLTLRQLGFGSALLVVVAALIYNGAGGDGDGTRSSAAPSAPRPAMPTADTGGTNGAVESGTSALMANPFSTFQPTPLRDPAPAASPASPATPFVYVGKRIEGGRLVVVLSHRGRDVAVYGLGPLDAQYEVEKLDEREVVLLYLPLMTRQVLALVDPDIQEEN